MKQEAMQKHPEEWFFLHNFDVDRVFSTIRRTDYLVLFYIKMRQESHPDEKLYLADLAAEMGVKNGEIIKVACGGEGRKLIFDDVVVRVNKDAVTTMHIDTDESQAAGNPKVGEIVR